jgi:hypothetical protein
VERIGFEDRRHGFVAETDEGMGRALGEILADPTLAAEQGRAGRDLARSYSWTTALAPLRVLYQQLVQSTDVRRSRGSH